MTKNFQKKSVTTNNLVHLALLHLFIGSIYYSSGSQTVRRDALVRRFNFPRASRDNLVLCH